MTETSALAHERQQAQWLILFFLQGIAAFLYTILSYYTVRTDFELVLLLFVGLFAVFFVSLDLARTRRMVTFLLICGVLFRVGQLFSVPNLSDDVYRFLWDGRLLANHINPFWQLPKFFGTQLDVLQIPGINQEIYGEIYAGGIFFASYPPLCHLSFYLCTVFAPTNTMANIITIKCWLLAFDLGVIWLLLRLLAHLKMPRRYVLFYAFNPLVIVEVIGNTHFEPMMVFFILAALLLLLKEHPWLSAICFGLSVCAKIFPLIFMPLLLRRLGFKRTMLYGLIVAGVCVVCFMPLLWDAEIARNYGLGLTRFFQKFEFNASLYYILRWIGYQIKGYNTIQVLGRVLSLTIFCGVWTMVFLERRPTWERLPRMMLYAITIYFLCALVVHPWYITTLIALCVLTPLRYPLVWSTLLPLTYFTYRTKAYEESLTLVVLEYTLVLLFFFLEHRGVVQRIQWIQRVFYGKGDAPSREQAMAQGS